MNYLCLQNLRAKPGRTFGLALLTACLAFAIFGGCLLMSSLQRGLDSYEARLGADIIVVPTQARSHGTFESILLQGIPGYFYMDESTMEKISTREGVEAVSPQFYLASASAGCCSVAVQVIGFDPDTDFSIQPWIRESYAGEVGDHDLIVGSNIVIPENRVLRFYNIDCNVVAQLEETGTGLDNAVYANMDTIREMMESSAKVGFRYYDGNAQTAISSVFVRVADDVDVQSVADDINIHVRKVEASAATGMISSIAQGLHHVSHLAGALTVLIWVLAFGVFLVVFALMTHERVREFAVLRVLGASRAMLARLVWGEALLVSLIGSICGVALACLVGFPFSGLIRQTLGLPLLQPGIGVIVGYMLGAIALSVLTGSLTALVCVYRITRRDTGLLLREEA